ncbi:LOW QUALITY PROTEIN: CCR4-NOT transcription complex subunit 10 [Notothenia coriiceps]|uniref:CCR4-NOT transcription complex subunit 10 n=1 Tax=Notothenia coriiceps TaxID=8208 RepID=A0A6I9MYY6_9TELE|nr:PREDICTED: LOW QUALITY PROTEIN: CCR4-NOT transcription complex subunit 10-like [Notothenia coriiceps]
MELLRDNCQKNTSQEEMMSCCSSQSGKYDESLKHLETLQELNKEDYKIAMNKAVVEFYKSSQTTTGTLKQTLMAMKNQVHTSAEDIDGLDDVENSWLYYNQAIIHYHMRQYSDAIAIGERLYQFLEPFEKFAQAVCFLLVDLYLLTFQPEKALHLLAVLDKLSTTGSSKNGKGESSNKDGANQKAEFTAMMEAAKSKMHQYKVRAYIQMKSSKACKREIKSVMNTAGNSAPSLFLKSNFEYLRGNYRKAVKLLNSSNIAEHPGPIKTGECVRCMFWNNLGCIHFAMGKHNLGIFYFKKALQENDHTCAQLGDGSNAHGEAGARLSTVNNGFLLTEELLFDSCVMMCCSGKGPEADKFLSAAPSSPLRKQEVENLRCSILACSAYVALALGDNLMALNHAEKLLHQTKVSGSLKFLGHLYAAEALISLDRISDAIGHLNPENVSDVSMGVLSSEQDQGSDKGEEPVESSGKQTPLCYPSSVTSARAMMLFNLGSAYCLRSEYEKARKCLHQAASMVNTKEIPPEAILLAVYLELQNGNTQLALQIIKRNQLLPSPVQRVSPDSRKKPVQPIQLPSSFTQVQRK